MNSVPNVRGNIVWYALPRFASRAAALLLLPLYTRVLSPGDFGLAMVALAAGGLLNLAIAPGAERLYLHWAFGEKGTRYPPGAVLGSISILHIAVLASSILVLAIWADPISYLLLQGLDSFPYFYIILATAGLASLSAPLRAAWRAQHRADKLALLDVTHAGISVVVILFGLLWFEAGAISILLGDLLAHTLLLPLYFKKAISGVLSGWSWQVARILMPEASVGLPLSLSGWVFSGFDRILLAAFAGAAEVGIYSVGYQVGAAIMLMSVILNKEWQPLIFGLGTSDTEKTSQLQALWRRSLSLFLATGSLLVFLSAHIIELLLDSSYAASINIVPFVVALAITQVAHSFLVNVGIMSHNPAMLLRESILSATVFVLASSVLIPNYGAVGMATAGLLARLIGSGYLFLSRWNPFSVDVYLGLYAAVFASCALSAQLDKDGVTELVLGGAVFVFAAYQSGQYWIFLGTLSAPGTES